MQFIRRWHSLIYHSLCVMLLLTLWKYFSLQWNAIRRWHSLKYHILGVVVFLLAYWRYCNLQWITIRRWHSLKYHSLGDMLLLTLWRYFNVKLNAIHRVSVLLLQGGVNRILILINSKEMLEYIQCRHLSSCINLNTFSFSFIYITTLLSNLKDIKRIGSHLFKKKRMVNDDIVGKVLYP